MLHCTISNKLTRGKSQKVPQNLDNPIMDRLWYRVEHRFGKNTHISMISNSVTHLRSYTNSAIAVNSAPILPVTRAIADVSASSDDVSASSDDVSASSADIVASNDLRAIAAVAAPNAEVSTSSANVSASSADIVASNGDCFMMFHNVLSV